ncbi:MAG: YgjV family protein [Ignavibacteriales bacterium]|nr:YgjV family protein [Ignavibacteriales bacterium]
MDWYHLIGYAGSILIAVALMMNNIWKLRWFNMFGAFTFAVYGLIIQSYPVVLLNTWNTCVNAYHLFIAARKKDYFSLLQLPEVKTNYLDRFLQFYGRDIEKFFPEFDWEKLTKPQGYFILRNLIPVGLFVYEIQSAETVAIHLDYVIPDYRDLKNAHFSFSEQVKNFHEKGFHRFETRTTIKAHREYLMKIGFERDGKDSSLFRKNI